MNLPSETEQGLPEDAIEGLQQQYGKNQFHFEPAHRFIKLLWGIIKEPMFLLLIGAGLLYFILGQRQEGFLMLIAMCFVAAISIYQDQKSAKALQALKDLSEPRVTVIRSQKERSIPSEELVPGDLMLLSEGEKIPADAVLLQFNDLTVNEGIITGESFPVAKKLHDLLYQGSILNTGKCKARVVSTGTTTYLGKIGASITQYQEIRTELQLHTDKLVRQLALFGLGAFLLIFLLNYLQHSGLISSLLAGLTLAMAAIPEEIPVAFSSFMALGSYQMARKGILSRQPQTVESLGNVTTLCLDKTGTLTRNIMAVQYLYDHSTQLLIDTERESYGHAEVLYAGMLASEITPFDEMEKAIWNCYQASGRSDAPLKMIYEYPLEGQPPMMTHVYQQDDRIIAAAKGAAERILTVCQLKTKEKLRLLALVKQLASQGFRVIGVALAEPAGLPFPKTQDGFDWQFSGLIALYDPPRPEALSVVHQLQKAGIQVKLLTGDYLETAEHIANKTGVPLTERSYTGSEILQMSPEEVQQAVQTSHLFSRMFPEAKLKVIEALKANHEIVAMTGDGVNDGPALKAAHIGIALGKKGTEIARQSADLIITDDDLRKIPEAIQQGRKIFSNLKKALRYIISIHIPILLTASLPLVLHWKYPTLFEPIHVIFLELIMGPTCSIFFEREPAEPGLMLQRPRPRIKQLYTKKEVYLSVLQGILITAGVLTLYYYTQNGPITYTRTMVFTTLICSNIFLTFTNRSFEATIAETLRYRNNLALPLVLLSTVFLTTILTIGPLRQLFALQPISMSDFGICLLTAFVCVFWFEGYKYAANRPGDHTHRTD